MDIKHLNEEQIAMVADALNEGNINSLPIDVKKHLSECNECTDKALFVSEISITNNLDSISPIKNKNNLLKYSIYIIAAASIIILFLVFFLKKPIKVDNNIAFSNDTIIINKHKDTTKTIVNQKYIDKKKLINKTKNSNQIAFATNINLENTYKRFSNSEMRSTRLTILSQHSINTKNPSDIYLKWTKPSNPIIIEIFNNNGEKLFTKETNDSILKVNNITSEGLYYWKILDEDYNLLYCGKIVYKKSLVSN